MLFKISEPWKSLSRSLVSYWCTSPETSLEKCCVGNSNCLWKWLAISDISSNQVWDFVALRFKVFVEKRGATIWATLVYPPELISEGVCFHCYYGLLIRLQLWTRGSLSRNEFKCLSSCDIVLIVSCPTITPSWTFYTDERFYVFYFFDGIAAIFSNASPEFLHDEEEQGNSISDEKEIESALKFHQLDRCIILFFFLLLMWLLAWRVECFLHPMTDESCLHDSLNPATHDGRHYTYNARMTHSIMSWPIVNFW